MLHIPSENVDGRLIPASNVAVARSDATEISRAPNVWPKKWPCVHIRTIAKLLPRKHPLRGPLVIGVRVRRQLRIALGPRTPRQQLLSSALGRKQGFSVVAIG